MKIVSELKDLSLLENYDVDGWIVSILGLSCYYDKLYTLDDIRKIVEIAHKNNQMVYVNAKIVPNLFNLHHFFYFFLLPYYIPF